jgi:hypothetical protein
MDPRYSLKNNALSPFNQFIGALDRNCILEYQCALFDAQECVEKLKLK